MSQKVNSLQNTLKVFQTSGGTKRCPLSPLEPLMTRGEMGRGALKNFGGGGVWCPAVRRCPILGIRGFGELLMALRAFNFVRVRFVSFK